MELDELKASWHGLDRRVNELAVINRRLVTETQTRKARWRLLPVLIGALVNIGVGGWLTGVFARFWIAHTETASAVLAGIALQAASIGVIVAGVMQLLIVTRINYARPVVTIQRYLAWLRAWELRAFHWAWLTAWLLLPAVIVACAMSFAQVDLWSEAPWVVLVGGAVGLSGALLSAFFHRWAHRPGGKLGAWLDRLLVNGSVESARSAIEEIDRFARE
jgi:hypothetical protein